jgi:hypothetical protein
MEEVKRALKKLEASLAAGQTRVSIAANGAVVFSGWAGEARSGLNDACAYRTLAAEGSWALRQAVARAEAQSGKKVNPRAVAAGWHTHDSGRTWGKH